jgi:hypothetical protein
LNIPQIDRRLAFFVLKMKKKAPVLDHVLLLKTIPSAYHCYFKATELHEPLETEKEQVKI